jgi:hypothetical protein
MSTNMETAVTFANKVRAELRHLTPEQVADLTDGLEADVASSLDDGVEIGSASKYATDLLVAANLSTGTDTQPASLEEFINKVRRWMHSISDLAPAWWFFRAWVVTQVIGFFLFHDQTSSPGYLEWRYKQGWGIVVLGVMLYLSVRLGRIKIIKWKNVLLVSHVLLAIAGMSFMFSEPRGETGSINNIELRPGETLCPLVPAPDLGGLSVADAKALLTGMGMAWTFFDQDAMMSLANVPQEVEVIQQNPRPGVQVCRLSAVQLIVDLAAPRATDIPQKSAATTIPKATTTTSP